MSPCLCGQFPSSKDRNYVGYPLRRTFVGVTATNSAIFAPELDADESLLRNFVQTRSPDAFAGIVRRHAGLVHGTALRALGGDASLADDVTQAVFVVFARKASTLRAAAVLPSWLHQTTLYAVANARKTKSRRAYHERQAANHRPEADMTAAHSAADDSSALIALLDEAIASLSSKDRSALLARYFEGASAADIARRQNSTAEATQKRLERAIEKLRAYFIRRSINTSATSVSTILIASAAHDAPAALINSISTTSLTAATSASVAGITKGTLAMMNWIKLKLAALVTAGALSTAGVGVVIAQVNQTADRAGQSPATQPTTSPAAPNADSQRPVSDDALSLRRIAAMSRVRAYVLRTRAYEIRQKQMPPANYVVLGNDNQPLVSPFSKDGKTGYVYLADESVVSSRVAHAETTAIVYDDASKSEADSPDAGVAVGFLDGHAEWVLAKDFPQLLKASEQALEAAKGN